MDEDPDRTAEESPVAAVARDIGEALMFVPEVQAAVQGVTLAALSVVFVPLGLGFLLISAILYAVLFAWLQLPPGGVTSALALGWWLATLVLMFVLFRRIYHRLGTRSSRLRRVVDLGFNPPTGSGPVAASANASLSRPSEPSAARPTLAELDARHAPRAPDGSNKPPG